MSLASFLSAVRRGYWRFVSDYRDYAKLRGFATEINDWPYVRRSFLECWAEPGFHRFWRVWNPGVSYFVYQLYLRLGGKRRRSLATVASFTANGFVHNFVAYPLLGWSWTLPTAFFCFGVLTVASRAGAPWLRQGRWPWPFNLGVNAGLVAFGFDLGFRLDRILS